MEIHPLDSERELEQAVQLTAAAWHEAFEHILTEDELETTSNELLSDVSTKYANLQDMSKGLVLVADDREILGWVSVTWHPERTQDYTDDGEAEIRTLYVHPDRWNEEIGTELLEEVIQRLPDSIEQVVLETFQENQHGKSFYTSRGFNVRTTTEFEVAGNRYPSVVLTRDL